MSIEEAVIEKLRALPADNRPRKRVEGLWADLGVTISAEDIEEVRREMWHNFPREFEL